MSNGKVKVIGCGIDMLTAGLELAMAIAPPVTSWCLTGAGMMVYWREDPSSEHYKFMSTQTADQLGGQILNWIEGLNEKEFQTYAGQQPHIDGSCHRNGFLLTSGHLGSYLVASICPAWIEVHK